MGFGKEASFHVLQVPSLSKEDPHFSPNPTTSPPTPRLRPMSSSPSSVPASSISPTPSIAPAGYGQPHLLSVDFLTYNCIILLVHTYRRLESNHDFSKITSFGDLGSAEPAGRSAVDAMIILSHVGFCIGYLIFITNTLAFVFTFSYESEPSQNSPKSIYIWGCFPFQLGSI